jgi:hypothetical protein
VFIHKVFQGCLLLLIPSSFVVLDKEGPPPGSSQNVRAIKVFKNKNIMQSIE